jgi:hypothetical protein
MIGHRWLKWLLPRLELYGGFRISFSQFGEDLLIASLVRDIQYGTYVDVGCNSPVRFNNTYRLYLQGWSGLNIDGNSALIAKYARIRPRDISICEVISSDKTQTPFFISESGLQSSLSQKFLGTEKIDRTEIMTPKALSDVLDEYKFTNKKIDLLCIDIEGYDLDAIKSLNFSKHRPYIICIEDFEFQITDKKKSQISDYLTKLKYIFVGHCHPSILFIDGDSKENQHL